MNRLRLLLPSLALAALTATGCFLVSAQVLVHFSIGSLVIANPAAVNGVFVDLNTIEDYNDNKDKLKDVSDLALLGAFTNNGASALDVEVWITASNTGTLSESQIRAQGTRLWGPFRLGAGETRKISWDASAALFQKDGKAILIAETKGDGQFSIYTIGAVGVFDLAVDDGVLVLVLDAAN